MSTLKTDLRQILNFEKFVEQDVVYKKKHWEVM